MRLLFVNSAWAESWGGGEKWTITAADWFRRRGHEVCVVARPQSRLQSAAVSHDVSVIETRFGGDFDPLALWRAHKIVRHFRPHLIVVNFNKEAWQFGGAAKLTGTPVVARHGFPLLNRNHHHRFLKERLITKLVVNAASILEEYAEHGIPTDDVELIYNGVQQVEQKPGEFRRRFDIGSDDVLIVTAGRLESQKRLDRFIAIAAHLLPRHPTLKFLIAGDGPLRDSLQHQIAELSLQKNVRIVGFLEDFPQVVGDADLFVLASDKEGTPNVLLEAMAASVACVSSAVGAVPVIFGDELADNAIPPDNVAAFVERIHLLLDQPQLRREVTEKMRIRVRDEFSLDSSMKQFESLFGNLLAERT